ncbi:aminopeptidase A, Metallo peptidase, MEROPS family M17 [Magnetococcus marinus MC-1]|uniref:Probable cytosol aminopeptidase n=1 Tax=Magnetococcus marinus (strain ATCC BAA-1437 / JCM 17883 / MC-1) TaxID=156889 RepID=A0LB29_MAGMM|nr:leucyl aminopeptidase [Magnetococcus marinus]ABK45172.1 aminopeptidase A, Metallo peptidase, MEROPS family M17 [Magnetococcus marinus MC-1]
MTEHAFQVVSETSTPDSWQADALIIGVFGGDKPKMQEGLTDLDKKVVKVIKQAIKAGWCKGKLGETLPLPMPDGSGLSVARLLLLGLGKPEELDAETLRQAGGHLVKACDSHSIESAITLMSDLAMAQVESARALYTLLEGVWLGRYRFEQYRSADDEPVTRLQKLCCATSKKMADETQTVLDKVAAAAAGVWFCRDLCNQPGNVLTPKTLADEAVKLGEGDAIKTTVMDVTRLRRKGMNGILAVGQGSDTPPRMIVMEYRKGGDKPLLAVVGKAITFDSGGISLKPGANMDHMKYDMSGGGAVFGLMKALAQLNWPVNVVGVVPTAENMPDGKAQRPGDVITMSNGKTVEVLNTDAEGRLILADALHYACGLKPAAVVDLATLTGACVVALGHHASGLLGNDDALQTELEAAGISSGERVWRLPLFKEYQEQIKSKVADIQNIGEKGAGTITAACFLSRFVEEGIPWAHLDIAGTAWGVPGKSYIGEGSTGSSVRLLLQWVERRMAASEA